MPPKAKVPKLHVEKTQKFLFALPTILRPLSYNLCNHQVLVIIDAKPKDLGLPTDAYVAVEEVHDVSL